MIKPIMKSSHLFNYKRNRIQQIKGFYHAAKLNSISEAARSMNLTQSTVTLQIQSLERDLGIKLFERASKPLSLTADGEEFYKTACPLIQEFESVIENFLDKKNKKEQNSIDIAVHHVAISYLMPEIIATFKIKYPKSKIIIRNISQNEAISRLKSGDIDLALYPNVHQDPEIDYIDTISYDPILIMNKHHPLSNQEITSLKDLKNFDLIRIDQNLITLPLFEEAVKSYGLKGSIEFENGNWEALKHFVKRDNFIAVISTICLDKNDNILIAKNLSHLFPQMDYSLIHKKGSFQKEIVKSFSSTVNKVAMNLKKQKIT